MQLGAASRDQSLWGTARPSVSTSTLGPGLPTRLARTKREQLGTKVKGRGGANELVGSMKWRQQLHDFELFAPRAFADEAGATAMRAARRWFDGVGNTGCDWKRRGHIEDARSLPRRRRSRRGRQSAVSVRHGFWKERRVAAAPLIDFVQTPFLQECSLFWEIGGGAVRVRKIGQPTKRVHGF
jgi:hypothetical protein